jgi:hypothetical protein
LLTEVARQCVVKATLTGDLGHRRQEVIAEILDQHDDPLRYLIYLLGDPASDYLYAELGGADRDGTAGQGAAWTSSEPALLELLVRAVGQNSEALERVKQALPDIEGRLPQEFSELWSVVWQAHQEMRV